MTTCIHNVWISMYTLQALTPVFRTKEQRCTVKGESPPTLKSILTIFKGDTNYYCTVTTTWDTYLFLLCQSSRNYWSVVWSEKQRPQQYQCALHPTDPLGVVSLVFSLQHSQAEILSASIKESFREDIKT